MWKTRSKGDDLLAFSFDFLKDCIVLVAAESVPHAQPFRQCSQRRFASVDLMIHKQIKGIVANFYDFE
jgi:hypothetical protein